MQASALLLRWGSYCGARNLLVLIIYFSFLLCCPLCFQGLPQTQQRVFPGVWKPLFLIPLLGWSSLPTSFVSFFIFYFFSYLFLKTMICFSGCLMSSASIQKLFCGVCPALKCSFDASVREKVVSPFYSSTILGLPPFFPFKASQALGVKNSPANAGDIRGTDLIPGLGSSTGGGRENPLQYSFLENPLDRGV